MKHYEIISLHRKGKSFRSIAKELDVDRKTVAKICHRHEEALAKQTDVSLSDNKDEVVRQIMDQASYDSSNRKKRTFTPAVQKRMEALIANEEVKTAKLGSGHKQKLTAKAVHDILQEEGHQLSYRTVAHYWGVYKEKSKEAFIRQTYNYGDRLEFDFGEVKLEIAGRVDTYYLAVLASPASGFYWSYLYTNQKQDVFFDAHVQFFDMVQGVYREVVYDNMRNVVTRFIGRSEKELNAELIKLSLYYGFDVNVTNCFRGNEKGSVEGRVKHVRRRCFSKHYQFPSIEAARDHLTQTLLTSNQPSSIAEEKEQLSPYRPPYELATLRTSVVNKYSCIQMGKNHYSVPDYLVGKKVQIKEYHETLQVYAHHHFVCEHQKIEGSEHYCLNIRHYLKTLQKKPGALSRSLALKQNPQLYTLYHRYYKQKPKEFIAILTEYVHEPMATILLQLKEQRDTFKAKEPNQVNQAIQEDWARLNQLYGLEMKS